jgi:hypothetical protein
MYSIEVYHANMSPKAHFFRHEKYADSFGNTAEIKIWIVPVSLHHPDGVKYSLVYVVNGERVIGFDNERGKGDHLHYYDTESPYTFSNVGILLKDFLQKVRDWKEQRYGN